MRPREPPKDGTRDRRDLLGTRADRVGPGWPGLYPILARAGVGAGAERSGSLRMPIPNTDLCVLAGSAGVLNAVLCGLAGSAEVSNAELCGLLIVER